MIVGVDLRGLHEFIDRCPTTDESLIQDIVHDSLSFTLSMEWQECKQQRMTKDVSNVIPSSTVIRPRTDSLLLVHFNGAAIHA